MTQNARHYLFVVLAASLALFHGNNVYAQLTAGDIAIIGFNFDDPDEFTFVSLDNLAGGEQIVFTDSGWNDSSNLGSFRATEGIVTYTVPGAGLAAGTIVNQPTGSMNFSASGDSIIAFQGTVASPSNFIFALNSESTGWQTESTSSNTSGLPPGLAGPPVANFAINEVDNAFFNTSVLASGSKSDWLGAITNSANWTTDNTNPLVLPSGTISVTGSTPPPPPLPVPASDLILTGVVDGDLPGGLPKAIELYTVRDIPDLSIYGLEAASNGAAAASEEFFLSGSATAGQFLYVTTESTEFTNFFGFGPDFIDSVASINGDDALLLYLNGQVVDVFGDVGVDGTGQPWEYTDGWAYRVDGTGNDGDIFVFDNWFFGSLENETTNASATEPFPIGTFAPAAVPEPASLAMWSLLGMLGAGAAWRLRKRRA